MKTIDLRINSSEAEAIAKRIHRRRRWQAEKDDPDTHPSITFVAPFHLIQTQRQSTYNH